MARIIEIVPYNLNWPLLFMEESRFIKQALGDNCIDIHHVGSTSIVGLSAKPVIDMIPVVKNILDVDKVIDKMVDLGYESKGEFGMPFRRFFMKGGDNRTHHAHVFEEHNPEINRHVKFRDWMREHEGDRKLYENLKIELAQKYSTDPIAYSLNKDLFISNIDAKTGCDGLRIVKTLTEREWESARYFRQKYVPQNSVQNSLTGTSERSDPVHFTCYKGAEIIGYALVEFSSHNKAELKIMVVDEKYKNNKIEVDFFNLCDRWINQCRI